MIMMTMTKGIMIRYLDYFITVPYNNNSDADRRKEKNESSRARFETARAQKSIL